MLLVLGLGNPGARYEATRHNAGFLVADRLAERFGVPFDRKQLGALVTSVRFNTTGNRDGQAVLAKPQGFMNLSGQVATSLRGFYKVETQDVIVVHDEVDLPFGDVRVKKGGGHGGHNGVRDVIAKLGTPGFVRVRVGVGRPPEGWDTADYVLGKFAAAEAAEVPAIVDRAADAVERIAVEGVERAMQIANSRATSRAPSSS
jgi:peptidyl-tRNA hydrolase, PTH1 family